MDPEWQDNLKKRKKEKKNSIITNVPKEFTKGKYLLRLTGVLDLCCWEFCPGVAPVGVKNRRYTCKPSIPPKPSHGFAVCCWHDSHGFGLWEQWRREKSVQNHRKSQVRCISANHSTGKHARTAMFSVLISACSERSMKWMHLLFISFRGKRLNNWH